MRIKIPQNLINPEELRSLRPKDRDQYVQKTILQILELNPQGATISELAGRTKNPQALVRQTRKSVAGFVAGADQSDDITILAARVV